MSTEQSWFSSLRERAEAQLADFIDEYPEIPLQPLRRLFNELTTHHIELELQNEELRKTQEELLTYTAKIYQIRRPIHQHPDRSACNNSVH